MGTPGIEPVAAVADDLAYYYRVRVENLGGGEATGCQVKLTRAWSVSDGGLWQPMPEWQSVVLRWSGTGAIERTVHGNDHAYADIGHVLSNYLQSNRAPMGRRVFNRSGRKGGPAWLYLDIDPLYNSQYTVLAYGRYCLELRAVAAGARTVTTWFEINFPGEFAELIDIRGKQFGGVNVSPRSRAPEDGESSAESL